MLYAAEEFNTRLIKGDDEPIFCYPRADLPADDDFYPLTPYHRRSRDCLPRGHDVSSIVFAHGFFASALHEISHWMCRRQGASRFS
ncbi:elongation factor P hydroxylase [Klebsiella pneumoniae]|uniref:elongation factor P hydroxylase n=1 Tax=Klebsiella pneumoniae TaxID=573 RepID=UPI00398893C9